MTSDSPVVFVVDDDARVRDALSSLLASAGRQVVVFASATDFLRADKPDVPACLVLDLELPDIHGLDLQKELAQEFPERPGALMEFLDRLGGRWNISLFHYRNHGADFGRVLAAFEVPEAELAEFRGFLDRLGYPSFPEAANPAYAMFLAGNGG